MAQRIGLIKAIPYSFFSKKLYSEVVATWRARGFLYLLLIAFLFSFCTTFSSAQALSNLAQVIQNEIVPQLPTITFEDGVASIAHRGPVHIKDFDGRELLLIDTSVRPLPFDKTDAVIIVQRHSLLIKESKSVVKHIIYSTNWNGHWTQEKMQKFLHDFRVFIFKIGFVLLYIPHFLVASLLLFLGTVMGALFGLIVSWLLKKHLSYLSLLNLMCLAMTPMLFLWGIFSVLDMHFPFSGWLFVGVTLFYLIFGIKVSDSAVNVS